MLLKTNKQFFTVATSLALNFLSATSFGELIVPNNHVAFAGLKSNSQNLINDNSTAIQSKVPVGDLAKPAVVQVISGCGASIPIDGKNYEVSTGGKGTGFFVNSNGYIATNAHVVKTSQHSEICQQSKVLRRLEKDLIYKIAENSSVSAYKIVSNSDMMQKIESEFQNAQIHQINKVILPNGDALNFEIKQYGAPVGEGKDVAIIKVPIMGNPVLKVAETNQVKTQDKVTILGYPRLELGKLFDKTSEVEVTISKGEISSTNKRLSDGLKVLQFNAAVTHGNSGGPVLNEQGEVVGIATFAPANIDGIAFALTSETIMEFIKSAGITNEQGIVDQLYKEGLQLYQMGKYSLAMLNLQFVKILFPQHSEVDEYIQEAEKRMITARSFVTS